MTLDPGQEFDNTPIGEATIGCCVCLNTSGVHVPATTLAKSYAVCDAHAPALSIAFSDFPQLIKRIKTQGDPV